MIYIYKDNVLKKHNSLEIPNGWKRITLEEWEQYKKENFETPRNKELKEKRKLVIEKNRIEKELNNISSFYITKVVVFKEWEENDQRALDLIAKRESLRKRHDEIKELLK